MLSRSWLAATALAAILAIATPAAHADSAEPLADDDRSMSTGEDEEAEDPRTGFAFGVTIGPRQVLAFDVDGAGGTGATFAIRMGTSAGNRLWWMLELQNTTDPQGGADELNQFGSLTLGAQYYVQDAFWLRGGTGLATLVHHEGRERIGLAVTGAGGYDLFSRGIFTLSLELGILINLYRNDGNVIALGSALSANWY